MNLLNKATAQALFEEHAILFGDTDGVPEAQAISIFGKDAVDFAKRLQVASPYLTFNGYGIGDYTAWYLTKHGFFRATTYHNVHQLKQGESEG